MTKDKLKTLYRKDPETGCWDLIGSTTVVRYDGKLWKIVPLLWSLVKKVPVPKGKALRRLCPNAICVSPHHREIVDRNEHLKQYQFKEDSR